MLEIATKVFFILLVFLLIVNLFAFVLYGTASEPVTFTQLLDKLHNAPQIDLDLPTSVQIFQIAQDWGVFNFLRDYIINPLGAVLGLVVWIGAILLNMISIIGYLVYLFGLSSVSAIVVS